MTRARILLVTPAFHGYGRSIADALGRAGHTVRLHEYDRNATWARKVRHKAAYELPDRLMGGEGGSRRHDRYITEQAVLAVTQTASDVIVTVKGDALGSDYWTALDHSGSRQLLWLYDELARMRFPQAVLTSRPSIVSYSPHDVRVLAGMGLRTAHVLDAYDHTLPVVARPSADVVFIGARYPERDRLMTHLHSAGVPVRAYGREWSNHPVDRMRTWRLGSSSVPSGRDVPRGTAYGITGGAIAALNSHTDQDGFTMRTYEIPGSGGLQLIDRPDVSDIYVPDEEVLVFSSYDELVELSRRAARDRAWACRLAVRARARTLAEHTFDHRVPILEAAWD